MKFLLIVVLTLIASAVQAQTCTCNGINTSDSITITNADVPLKSLEFKTNIGDRIGQVWSTNAGGGITVGSFFGTFGTSTQRDATTTLSATAGGFGIVSFNQTQISLNANDGTSSVRMYGFTNPSGNFPLTGVTIGENGAPDAMLDVRGAAIFGGNSGNTLRLFRNATTSNDGPIVTFQQKNSIGLRKDAALITGELTNASAGSEAGRIRYFTMTLDTPTEKMAVGRGVVVGSGTHAPIGGDQGEGSVNAQRLFVDSIELSDWVFSGESNKKLYALHETRLTTETEHRLPWMPTATNFAQERHVGGMITRLWEGQEHQQRYIFQLEQRIKRLERQLRRRR